MKYFLNHILLLMMFGMHAPAESIDLAGDWRFALDADDGLIKLAPADWKFPDRIKLPGILTAQGFGETPSIRTQWTGSGWRYKDLFKEWQSDDHFKFPFFLQPPKHYVGAAWYQKEVVVPASWKGNHALLHLERVHWQSTVWVDGNEVGKNDSLGTPHVIDLGLLAQGKHVITLRVDNRLSPVNVGSLSHSVTDHTQGNWNGVVGKIELRKVSPNKISGVEVHPSVDGSVKVIVTGIIDENTHDSKIQLEVSDATNSGKRMVISSEKIERQADGRFRAELAGKMPDAKPWSEFDPSLYTARAVLSVGDAAVGDSMTTVFGFREVANKGGYITLNGRRIFLRGTLECSIFPLLGHPPTDVAAWKRIIRICKAHGLNHIRFHSWCPPEAAFQAADELGFYYQVEVSSWANDDAQIGSGLPLDAWLEAESKRMLAVYGNHPSFLLMAYGNEPGGPNHPQWLQDWVARRKAEDNRRLYTTAAGWPMRAGSDYHNVPNPRIQGWGQGMGSIINGQPPRTDFDWSSFVKSRAGTPVVSHEIGQWCVYPNFKEIAKYTGYFKARNFEIFQETARRNGLLGQAKDILDASGKLQALAYKHEIEAALRTPDFGGFQLLDLHDFPGQGTALIGVLDAFWDEKGYITAKEFSHFCGSIVPLARMKKMVFTNAEHVEADLEISHFGPKDLKRAVVKWSLAEVTGKSKVLVGSGVMPAVDLPAGGLYPLGKIDVALKNVTAPAKLQLVVVIDGTAEMNSWDVFVYPSVGEATTPQDVLVTDDLADAKASLENGGKVLWIPTPASVRDDLKRPLVAGFSPIFWNTAWTNWQPPHTLGILCDPKHPALAKFPTDAHSNWQWWEIQQNARPFILTNHRDLKPVVQVIDDWVTNRKLGYVFEARIGKGRVIACGVDLTSDLERRPVVRQLKASLLDYMQSKKFAPAVSLEVADLESLVKPLSQVLRLKAAVSATSNEPSYQAAKAVDGDVATIWHSEFTRKQSSLPCDLKFVFPALQSISAVMLTQRQDHNSNGQPDQVEILDDAGKTLVSARVIKDAVAQRIDLPAGTRVKSLTLRVLTSHSGSFASLAEFDVVPSL